MGKKKPEKAPTILIDPKGKIKVFGEILITNKQGETIIVNEEKTTLCGCGKSKEWPICDGSHKKWKGPKSGFK